MNSPADLELRNISKRYGGVVALDNVSLKCLAGEVHGLVGENGAGKSTIIKVLAANVPFDAGEIVLRGSPFRPKRTADAIKSGIGVVYQELSLLPDLTVGENVFYGHSGLARAGRVSRHTLRDQSYRLFDKLGVEVADPDKPVRELSLASRQMVEIAKVIARDPQVIVFDEATSALGRYQSAWLLRYCRQLASEGKVVIYISHKLSEIQESADRITVFRNGRDVGVRQRNEASTDDLIALILGRRVQRLFPPRLADVQTELALSVNSLKRGDFLDVSFDLRKGEILGIGGLTGQGQDELFRALYGIAPLPGSILIEGHPAKITSADVALRSSNGIALVPEDRASQGLLLAKSVASNITLSILANLSRIGLLQRERERAVVAAAITRFGIKVQDPHDPVQRLSGGNQQKVVLAKLLATGPKILMLFDSTRGVDVGTKVEIFQLLRELTAKGAAVLFYSTDIDELINMCDRVLVMRQGKVEIELSDDNLTQENMIRAAMGEAIAHRAAPRPTIN